MGLISHSDICKRISASAVTGWNAFKEIIATVYIGITVYPKMITNNAEAKNRLQEFHKMKRSGFTFAMIISTLERLLYDSRR